MAKRNPLSYQIGGIWANGYDKELHGVPALLIAKTTLGLLMVLSLVVGISSRSSAPGPRATPSGRGVTAAKPTGRLPSSHLDVPSGEPSPQVKGRSTRSNGASFHF